MNVCPGEGVAYDSYYNETDRVKYHRLEGRTEGGPCAPPSGEAPSGSPGNL